MVHARRDRGMRTTNRKECKAYVRGCGMLQGSEQREGNGTSAGDLKGALEVW